MAAIGSRNYADDGREIVTDPERGSEEYPAEIVRDADDPRTSYGRQAYPWGREVTDYKTGNNRVIKRCGVGVFIY